MSSSGAHPTVPVILVTYRSPPRVRGQPSPAKIYDDIRPATATFSDVIDGVITGCGARRA
jgi:hypothetical protein